MKNRSLGMVLLSTLCVIGMITLLLVTCLQQNALYAKVLQNQQKRDRHLYYMEKLALSLLSHPADSCMIEAQDANKILDLLSVKGCKIQYEDRNYRYLIENMGINPCLMIKDKASKQSRLTLLMTGESWFLQIVKMEAAVSIQPCFQSETRIKAGVTSWRLGNAHIAH